MFWCTLKTGLLVPSFQSRSACNILCRFMNMEVEQIEKSYSEIHSFIYDIIRKRQQTI